MPVYLKSEKLTRYTKIQKKRKKDHSDNYVEPHQIPKHAGDLAKMSPKLLVHQS